MMKILILGASGSIGQQTLEVIEKYPNNFLLTAFSVGENIFYIDEILKKHPSVKHICLKNEKDIDVFKVKHPSINFYFGDDGLIDLIQTSDFDMAVNALVGFVGLLPSVEVLKLIFSSL